MKAHLALLALLAPTAALHAAELRIHCGAPDGQNGTLHGADAMLQLLVTASDAPGKERDATREVTWKVEPDGLLSISPTGRATPLRDGTATLTATKDGAQATATLLIQGAATDRPLHFKHDIVPVMTKSGCNGGGCHGKSEGQNGFKLSLLGFEPGEDYEHLVHESRGRRLFPAAPESSLLLLKGTGEMPHGGGARMERGSPDYRTLVRWMEQGMPKGDPAAPAPVRLAIFPQERLLAPRQRTATPSHRPLLRRLLARRHRPRAI